MLNSLGRACARRTLFDDHKNLQDNSSHALAGLRRRSYRQDIAQNIRDGAGLPAGVSAGLQSGVSAGLTDAGALSAGTNNYTIGNESNISSIADSGSGTQSDPYIIDSREYNGGGSVVRAIRFYDYDASYHIKFTNCLFYDFTAQCIYMNSWGSGSVEFEQCEFYNSASNGELFWHYGGHLKLTNCLFSGCNSFAGYISGAGVSGILTLRNLAIDESGTSWKASSNVFYFNLCDIVIDASSIEITPPFTNDLEAVFQLLGCGDGSSITNAEMDANGDVAHFISDFANTAEKKQITLRYLDITDTNAEILYLRALENADITHCNFAHASWGTGTRVLYFISDASDSSIAIDGLDVRNCKITKAAGSGAAGDEACESVRGKDVRFAYCWVPECSEDAFEHVQVISGCSIAYCVADNCAGQVADFFKQWDEATWGAVDSAFGSDNAIDSQSYAHHLYGDCDDYGLILSGLRGVCFHDIYIDNTGSSNLPSVYIEDQDSIVVRDIYGAGPLPLQAARGNGSSTAAAALNGGASIDVSYFDSADGTGTLTSLS